MLLYSEGVRSQLATMVDQAENEEMNPLELWALLKELADTVKECQDQIKAQVVDFVETRCNANESYFGFEVAVYSRAVPDFKHIDAIMDAEKVLKELKAAATAAAKNVNIQAHDSETGEVIVPAKITYSTPTVTLKRPKNG